MIQVRPNKTLPPEWVWLSSIVVVSLVAVHGAFNTNEIFYFRDLSSYYWTHHLSLRRAIFSGWFPLWDPNPSFGAPVAGDATLQLFFLPTLPVRLLLPDVLAFNLTVALPVPAAALGTYLFFRRSTSAGGAAIGAAAFAVSGALLSTLNSINLSTTAALVPWVLWCADRLCDRVTASRFAGLALVIALSLCAGEPVTLAGAFAVALTLGLARPGPIGGHNRARAVGLVAAAGLVGLLLAAVQALPAAAATARSVRGAGLLVDFWSLHPYRLVELALSEIFGEPFDTAADGSPWFNAVNGNAGAFLPSLYVGATVLALAVTGAVAGARSWSVFWCLVIAGSLLLALGDTTPAYDLLRETLPPFRQARYPSKFFLLCALGLAALAAAGCDALTAGSRRARVAAFTSACALAVLGGAALAIGSLAPPALAGPLAEIAGGLGLRDTAHASAVLLSALRPAGARLLLFAATTAFVVLVARARLSPTAAAAALLAFATVDLLSANAWLNPMLPVGLFREPSWVAATRRHPEYRTFSVHDSTVRRTGLDQDTLPELRIPDDMRVSETLAAYGGAVPEYLYAWGVREAFSADLPGMRPAESVWALQRFAESPRPIKDRFLRSASVRYYLTPRPPEGEHSLVARLEGLEPLALYELPDARPRAAVLTAAIVEPNTIRQILLTFDPALEPAATAVVSAEAAPAGTPGPAGPPTARLVVDEPERLVLEATAPAGGGYLVLRDSYDSDWVASVDGAEAQVVRANGLFRAVRITSGGHKVEFRYRPVHVYVGAAVSLLTGVALLVAVGLSRWATGDGRPTFLDEPSDL